MINHDVGGWIVFNYFKISSYSNRFPCCVFCSCLLTGRKKKHQMTNIEISRVGQSTNLIPVLSGWGARTSKAIFLKIKIIMAFFLNIKNYHGLFPEHQKLSWPFPWKSKSSWLFSDHQKLPWPFSCTSKITMGFFLNIIISNISTF